MIELLDELMEELDHQWCKGDFPNSILTDLIPRIAPDETDREEIICELCAADLEWRWRASEALAKDSLNLSTGFEHEMNSLQASPALSGWGDQSIVPQRPKAADYEHLLGDNSDLKQRMILAEWTARGLHGDKPELESFTKLFPADAHWEKRLQTALDAVSSLRAIVKYKEHQEFSRFVPPRFEIGRQGRDEDPPLAWVADRNKLVVADLETTCLSRKQLAVLRIAENRVRISNISKNVSLDSQSEVLRPGADLCRALPCEIEIGEATLLMRSVQT